MDTRGPQPEPHRRNYTPAATLRDAYRTWMDDARCLDADLSVFFPSKGEQTTAAKAICNDCDVRRPCLEYALAQPANEDFGVFGGTSERERRRLRQLRQLQPDSPDQPAGETTCGHCRRTFQRPVELAVHRRSCNPDRDQRIVDAVDHGIPVTRVADRFGIGRRSVYRAIERARGHTDREAS